ncbi:MAG: zinc ribbon domain-containing protein [Pontiellaceae bacterium]|nr:zinc ribbon domain-containing protein [Pontiellaceae bacterium]MBN2784444.1 zinc ribbon domain-containing protein [Pontiellaceae bacterium]
MPIFEYVCKKCGAEFEQLVPNADTKISCEKCGSKQVVKQFSVFSAASSAPKSNPCSSGACPTSGMAGTGCSGGGCPFS